jgi:uncharacterized membrane protein SpoIIM required for sporulation
VIVDMDRFIAREKPYWNELENALQEFERNARHRPSLAAVQRFHYLYLRVTSDLARLGGQAAEQETRQYLGALAARAYGEMSETRSARTRCRPLHWFLRVFPQTFRRHTRCFQGAVLALAGGMLVGGLALLLDPSAKSVLIPPMSAHLQSSPAERVAREEQAGTDVRLDGMAPFAASLMVHNTRVTLFAVGLGILWGAGTLLVLFYNGALLGAVIADYLAAGQGVFLAGWLLPHGSLEIPAILIGGQAGLLLGSAMLARNRRQTMRQRVQAVSRDITTLLYGTALLLVWAGVVEAFFSQNHEPAFPYSLKIALGAMQLALLTLFLARSGATPPSAAARSTAPTAPPPANAGAPPA